ncbi:MAG: transporter permease [Bacteroidetes bacterium]|nr:MAG: transporter permease [Bacteroidota bacterium]
MLKNHFKIAWRNLIRDKQFTVLNLLGLSIGLACALLIYLWVHEEMRVDKFNEKDARLYQVLKTAPNSDGTISVFDVTQGMLPRLMKSDFPEVEYSVAVRNQSEGIISIDDKHVKVLSKFVGPDFFKIFSYKLVDGDPNYNFSGKYDVLISDRLALKLFNSTQNLTGKTFNWDRGEFTGPYKIAGVYKAPPANATEQFDLLFSYSIYEEKEAEYVNVWYSNGMCTFLLLKPGTDLTAFNQKIKDYTRNKIKALPNAGDILPYEGNLFVQKYSDRYLYNHFENGVQSGGRIEYVKLFSIIAIFLLIIASINFMNLSTAKAAQRMKEVGIRKVIGADRLSLVWQYLSESILLSALALGIAIVIAILFLPVFRQITGKEIELSPDANIVYTAVIITLITGIFAGSYPAFYLSGFNPINVLKGKLQTKSGESWIRRGLVVFQFSVSVILIVTVMVIYRQMQLVQNKNLGFTKDNVIKFSNAGELQKHMVPFLEELKKIPGVANASSMSGDFVGNPAHGGGGIGWEGKDPNLGIEYYGTEADFDFIETMGIKMVQGRSFSREFSTDSNAVVFNQTALKAMGIQNPIGKTVSMWGAKKQIIGIAKDYNFESLYKSVRPAFIVFVPRSESTIVKIRSTDQRATIARIENLYKKFNQNLDFNFRFLDDDYQLLYSSEQKVTILSRYFAGIAIVISCLGLFGLAAFTTQKRQKEIGIRKVVGASLQDVVYLLSKDFLRLILIALAISIPISWWAANQWLQSFAYRVNMRADIFIITSFAVILITIITISFQTIRAALENPVKSLKVE